METGKQSAVKLDTWGCLTNKCTALKRKRVKRRVSKLRRKLGKQEINEAC